MNPWGSPEQESISNFSSNGFDDNFVSLSEDVKSEYSSFNFIPRIHVDLKTEKKPQSRSALLSYPPLKNPLTQMMSSDEYLARLEGKLHKIKGHRESDKQKGHNSSAKQMIEALSNVKEGHVRDLLDANTQQFLTDDMSSDNSRIDINPNTIMQKMFPEKTALSQEEVDWLIANDQLSILKDSHEAENLEKTHE